MKAFNLTMILTLASFALMVNISVATPNTPQTADSDSLLNRLFPSNKDFSELKDARRKISNAILQLDLEIPRLEAELDKMKEENDEKDWQGSIKSINSLLSKLSKAKVDAAKHKQNDEDDAGNFFHLKLAAFGCSSLENVPEIMSEDSITNAINLCENEKKTLETKIARFEELGKSLASKKTDISLQRESLITVEEKISRRLDIGFQQYLYTFFISLIYAAIVFFLMHKFFNVISNNPAIKTTIFSGDAGIQFITLFSIVIAVILFGVLGILKSNELSALLGGLSGYILGRSSSKDAKTSAQGAQNARRDQPA